MCVWEREADRAIDMQYIYRAVRGRAIVLREKLSLFFLNIHLLSTILFVDIVVKYRIIVAALIRRQEYFTFSSFQVTTFCMASKVIVISCMTMPNRLFSFYGVVQLKV